MVTSWGRINAMTRGRKQGRRLRWVPALGRTLPADAKQCDGHTLYNHKFAGQGGSREAALELYRRWIWADEQYDFRALCRAELTSKRLACHCQINDPLCHITVLLQVIDTPEPPPENAGRRRR
jgi:hypothetical protein